MLIINYIKLYIYDSNMPIYNYQTIIFDLSN